jgi:hypothetical protein
MDQGLLMRRIQIEGPSVAGFRLSRPAIGIADDAQKIERLGRSIAATEMILATPGGFGEIASIGELTDYRENAL